jgi:hypothetical protein
MYVCMYVCMYVFINIPCLKQSSHVRQYACIYARLYIYVFSRHASFFVFMYACMLNYVSGSYPNTDINNYVYTHIRIYPDLTHI